MRIFIEPTEPLLFRTGRPFIAGENNFAETIFPPTPETFQGALRAMIAAQWGKSSKGQERKTNDLFAEEKVVELIGKRENDRNVYGRFRITGLTLGVSDANTGKVTRLFPAPAHLIMAKVEEDGKEISVPVRLRPKSIPENSSNQPDKMQLLFPTELQSKQTTGKSEPLAGWLTPLGLKRALSETALPEPTEKEKAEGKESRTYRIPTRDIYVQESRLGIGMNNMTKTMREGYLYQVQMIRMQQHYGFVVDIELGNGAYGSREMPVPGDYEKALTTPPEKRVLEQGGWLTIGGEQRAAHFRVLASTDWVEEEGISQKKAGNLLYFATPTYFKNGWLPADSQLLPAQPFTAAINRYQPIGGWLLVPGSAAGASKLTRRCIPAGSVYYFEKSTQVKVEHPLTEYGWQIGYGIAYTGEY